MVFLLRNACISALDVVLYSSRYGGMAERSNAAVLKTVEGNTSGGSNPSSSANEKKSLYRGVEQSGSSLGS